MTATMRKIVPFFLLLGIIGMQALVLTGCNTAEGFGQDVENTGEAMQEGARDAKKELK